MCVSCEVLVINGVSCHETGCPDAWMDEVRECKECGAEFVPESKHDDFCGVHCANIYHFGSCDCEYCQEQNEEDLEECEVCGETEHVICIVDDVDESQHFLCRNHKDEYNRNKFLALEL